MVFSLFGCLYVLKGDGSRDRLWGWIIDGAYPRLMRSLVIDFYRLNTSNDSQKKKKKKRYHLELALLTCEDIEQREIYTSWRRPSVISRHQWSACTREAISINLRTRMWQQGFANWGRASLFVGGERGIAKTWRWVSNTLKLPSRSYQLDMRSEVAC